MGAREFTDEAERKRRQDRVNAIGTLVWGNAWQAPMAKALDLPRSRVAQWVLQTKDVKPVPKRVMDALAVIARDAVADLRRRADALDALPDDEGAPPVEGEPNPEGDAPQESGPTASASAEEFEDGFDMQGFLTQVGSEEPRDLGEMPKPKLYRVHSSFAGWGNVPMRHL